ncbi:hypothetical protein GEV33_000425 [Tenebrio molitor]|uniref:Uncharacterized protein n=1 Tax=Tenebrio molitor TaxID=7067 RepID=A0A8J6LR02_TENMO|nr:hypothetical protein GEV33_000425 [Tenebrio molitor]
MPSSLKRIEFIDFLKQYSLRSCPPLASYNAASRSNLAKGIALLNCFTITFLIFLHLTANEPSVTFGHFVNTPNPRLDGLVRPLGVKFRDHLILSLVTAETESTFYLVQSSLYSS